MKFSPKVQEALDQGKLWRAKEILSNQLAQSSYDVCLYEQYGAVFLMMGDDMEAGRYLFLSGVSKPDYKEAVDIFLNRCGKHDWSHLVQSFPGRARKTPISELPERVQATLYDLGLTSDHEEGQTAEEIQTAEHSVADTLFRTGLGLLLVLVVLIFLVGLVHSIEYLSTLLGF